MAFPGSSSGSEMQPHHPWLRFAEFNGGLLIWGAQFTIVYLATSVACGRGWAGATVLGFAAIPVLIVATTLVALMLTGALFLVALGRKRAGGLDPTGEFLTVSTMLASGLSLVAISYTALPALVVPPCP